LDEELTEIGASCRATIDGIKHSERQESDLFDLRDQLRVMTRKVDLLGAECAQLKSQEHQEYKACRKKFNKHKAAFTELYNDYGWAKSQYTHQELNGDGGPENGFHAPGGSVTQDAVVASALALQGESKEALRNTLAVVHQTRQMAPDILDTLVRQREQLEHMENQVSIVQSSLDRSKEHMRRIAGKMMRDKCLWVVSFVVLVLIIVVIVYSQYKGADTNTPSI